jgi:hypothetical protein
MAVDANAQSPGLRGTGEAAREGMDRQESGRSGCSHGATLVAPTQAELIGVGDASTFGIELRTTVGLAEV